MKSEEKMAVVARPFGQYGGKHWVLVRFNNREWVPSFHDLFRIIQAICYCEDEKYPPPARGRRMVTEFLVACTEEGAEWEQVRERFGIPDRERKEF